MLIVGLDLRNGATFVKIIKRLPEVPRLPNK